MTFEELYLRAMNGCQPEVRCVSLTLRFLHSGEDMPAAEYEELGNLINELGVDLESDDEARWTPAMNEET